jgi:hypothetical protein
MRAGLSAWARDAGRKLRLDDDESDPRSSARVHRELLEAGCRPVLGPYGSDTTRAVALAGSAEPVWNHGAAADDVQQLPGVVSVPTPSSRYLVAVARAAAELHGASRVAVLTAPGRFARFARSGSSARRPTWICASSAIPMQPTASSCAATWSGSRGGFVSSHGQGSSWGRVARASGCAARLAGRGSRAGGNNVEAVFHGDH